MSLKIQNAKNLKVFEIDSEAKLHYHLLDPLLQMRSLRKNMRNGKIDADQMFEMAYDFMELMVDDWEGILNEDDDKPIKFKKELVKTLPLDVAIKFVTDVVTPLFGSLIESAGKIGKVKEESKSGN